MNLMKVFAKHMKTLADPKVDPEVKERLADSIRFHRADGYSDTMKMRLMAWHLFDEKQKQLQELKEKENTQKEEKEPKKYVKRSGQTNSAKRRTQVENPSVGTRRKNSGRNRSA